MSKTLPPGFTVRPATHDDVQAVTAMLIACDLADYGEPDTSVEDVLAYWRREGFVMERDTWLVYAPDGALAACGIVLDNGVRARIDPTTNIHPRYRGLGLELFQVEQVEDWAQKHLESKTVQWVLLANQKENVELLEGRGYQVVRHDYVMEIEMDAPPPMPMLESGLVMRSFELGRDEHAVHSAIQEAFHDVWGHHTDLSFEAWWSGYGEHKDWSPELSCVVMDGDAVAAAAIAFNFNNGGWIRQLGVRRPWRRLGIGLAILHRIFGDFYARGVKKVGLGVDASSLTGATRLYERAGMHVKNHYARYEKELL
jgi:GNAT superfamily N-acetyltransferase